MKIAIMQPYFFPYIGYFQLLSSCDCFIFLDNVQYTKRRWINRNRIKINEMPYMFSVPLKKTNLTCPINKYEIDRDSVTQFNSSFLETLRHGYHRAPNYSSVSELVHNVIAPKEAYISRLAEKSVVTIAEYLNIEARILRASDILDDNSSKNISRSSRLIELIKAVGGDTYINLFMGQALYHESDFSSHGISLCFLKPAVSPYHQAGTKSFMPSLSIIDVLMHNDKNTIRLLLKTADIIHSSVI